MSIVNYGKKLLRENSLCLNHKRIHGENIRIWTPDFFESITWIEAPVEQYKSILHFFWSHVIILREVKNEHQLMELFQNTQLEKIDYEQALDLIQKANLQWFNENNKMLEHSIWTHQIWNEKKDLFITFENKDKYFAFNWESNSG